MSIKEIYETAEIAVIALKKEESLTPEKQEALKIAENVVEKYRSEYYTHLVQTRFEAQDLINNVKEAEEALKFIPESSHDSIVKLNEIIEENSKEMQNLVTFSPDVFYEKYFLTLSSSMSDTMNTEVLESERFKEWFGNSKVVDDKGHPMIVYHGTGANEFTKFSFDRFPGAYFAVNKSYSEWFAKARGDKGIMFKCYLRVANPLDLTALKVDKILYDEFVMYIKAKFGYDLPEAPMLKAQSEAFGGLWAWQYLRNAPDWLKLIKSKKDFDGFHYYENNPGDIQEGKENITEAWMVLDESQIKTADDRNTTYSLFSKDVRMKKGGKI